MSHPTKKQRLDDDDRAANDTLAATDNLLASFGALSVDELANIFAFLPVNGIMHSRGINKKSTEAAKITLVPHFLVEGEGKYNTMRVMTRALPNLQQITIGDPGFRYRYKWSDGEDPDEKEAAEYANWTSHDIEIISNFRKLRTLEICEELNGRYPVFFNFPLLQKLSIERCPYIKIDLDMLAGLPLLKELECDMNLRLTGNINSLRVLKDTLERVKIGRGVEGNFMELGDFPHLKELDLDNSAVTGDIQNIGENDFLSLEILRLPETVYGGHGYKLQRISDAPDLIRAIYLLKKQRPEITLIKWYAMLSEDSPDWYGPTFEDVYESPPFIIRRVEAGSRIGYRWETEYRPCEVNWLDPEPDRESDDYAKYIEELQEINSQVNTYRGFHQPPSEEEYDRLMEEHGHPRPYHEESTDESEDEESDNESSEEYFSFGSYVEEEDEESDRGSSDSEI